jgi:prophage tail gpP-like protein
VRVLGNAAIAEGSEGGAAPTAAEQNAIFSAQDRARALQTLAQRAAAETVASNGQSATAIRGISLQEARPQAGETVWNFILRQARRFGLVPWFSPDGKLIIAAPNYGGPVVHKIVRRVISDDREPNNVIKGSEKNDVGNCYSEVTVYGRGLGNDVARAPIVGRAVSPALPFYRPNVIHDLSVRDTDEANRRATRELMKAVHGRRTLEYVVRDHGNARALYATDTIVEVLDEVLGISGEWYVVSRDFICDRTSGTTTKLKLVSKGAILL